MGAHCSQPAAVSHERPQEISVLIEQINIKQLRPNSELFIMKNQLRRNACILKKRITSYEEQMKDPSDPRIKTFVSEHARSTELLKTVLHMQAVLELIA